tara:strand:- start:377 stop:616 length:240 start_codon:yes stop_codon:yes gene_type:complete
MGIKQHDGGGMSITGDDIYRFRWVAVKHALQLEVHTGMTMSRQGSVLPTAKRIVEGFGLKPARTKVKVLEQLTELLERV